MGKEHSNPEYKRNRAIILQGKPTCNYCDRPADTVDHIVAIMNGGGHDLDNLQPCCAQCNNRKGHKEVAQRNRSVSVIGGRNAVGSHSSHVVRLVKRGHYACKKVLTVAAKPDRAQWR